MVVEALEILEGMQQCSECGAMYEAGEVHECGMYEGEKSEDEDELDEFSGGGALAGGGGYTLPMGMRPSGPRRVSVSNIAHRSFGGLPKKHKKH